MKLFPSLCFCAVLAAGEAFAAAQPSAPIQLAVDATQAPLSVIAVDESLAVKPGPLTLYYPKWIPGEHRPDGPIAQLTGLQFNQGAIPWARDPFDAFTFHLRIPAGVQRLDIRFDYIEPELEAGQISGGASATAHLVDLNWNQVLLYPAGTPAQNLIYDPELRLPAGWKFGTALPVGKQSADTVTFSPVALNRLVDSPLIAGEYFRAIDITPRGEPIHHELDIVADSEEAIAWRPDLQQEMENLVTESGLLFGARHYRDYHFLLTLSDRVPHFGLEHHESDDSRVPERSLLGPGAGMVLGRLLAHEMTHSWNGKFRRPIGMSPPYYEAPMDDSMLWSYEGITNYVGWVLAARSALWTAAQFQQFLASAAAQMSIGRPAGAWQSLADSAVVLPFSNGLTGWIGWTRNAADFHVGAGLVWLEAATIIDRQTHGAKSFDDFCKLFYAGPNRGPELRTYTFDDLVHALNRIAPYDWAGFLRKRFVDLTTAPPTQGIEASGWRLIYSSEGPGVAANGVVDAAYSIGLTVAADGRVVTSLWGSPGFRAGLRPGMKILRVNGSAYAPQALLAAVAGSAQQEIELEVLNDGDRKDCAIDYRGGARYPHLMRVPAKPDELEEMIRPRAPRP